MAGEDTAMATEAPVAAEPITTIDASSEPEKSTKDSIMDENLVKDDKIELEKAVRQSVFIISSGRDIPSSPRSTHLCSRILLCRLQFAI